MENNNECNPVEERTKNSREVEGDREMNTVGEKRKEKEE